MTQPSTFPEALLLVAEQLLVVGETARGYSPTAAEAMALELHSALLRTMFRPGAKA